MPKEYKTIVIQCSERIYSKHCNIKPCIMQISIREEGIFDKSVIEFNCPKTRKEVMWGEI